MQNINKKGLSQIISVMLIIGLSLASISVLWVTIKELTNPDILLSEQTCLDYKINQPFSIIKACYNESSKELELNLEKKFDSEIKNIEFVVYDSQESSKYKCGESCNNCKLPSTKRIYYFSLEQQPEKVSLVLEGNCVIETREVGGC